MHPLGSYSTVSIYLWNILGKFALPDVHEVTTPDEAAAQYLTQC
jgi:hypothetical protein